MTKEDIISLISQGESDTLEFKEKFDREAVETCGKGAPKGHDRRQRGHKGAIKAPSELVMKVTIG